MMRDEKGFYYFVDRLGDTFRWKGENISTTEVAAILSRCTGVVDAAVYGVRVPWTEGRAGMAALVVNAAFDLESFRRDVDAQLPGYARPLILRIVSAITRTGTFKLQTRQLLEQGYNPAEIRDALYFYSNMPHRYVALDDRLYQRLTIGHESP